jgi:hypothetical protein
MGQLRWRRKWVSERGVAAPPEATLADTTTSVIFVGFPKRSPSKSRTCSAKVSKLMSTIKTQIPINLEHYGTAKIRPACIGYPASIQTPADSGMIVR